MTELAELCPLQYQIHILSQFARGILKKRIFNLHSFIKAIFEFSTFGNP
jgi:hypothetical protein